MEETGRWGKDIDLFLFCIPQIHGDIQDLSLIYLLRPPVLLQTTRFQTIMEQKQTGSSENYFCHRGEGSGRHEMDEGDWEAFTTSGKINQLQGGKVQPQETQYFIPLHRVQSTQLSDHYAAHWEQYCQWTNAAIKKINVDEGKSSLQQNAS